MIKDTLQILQHYEIKGQLLFTQPLSDPTWIMEIFYMAKCLTVLSTIDWNPFNTTLALQ